MVLTSRYDFGRANEGETAERNGERGRNRTFNLLIERPPKEEAVLHYG